MFERPVLLLAFVIQAAMKCQGTFCSDRKRSLQHEINNHLKRCSRSNPINLQCCDAEKSSLQERIKNHEMLCGKFYVVVYFLEFDIFQTPYPRSLFPIQKMFQNIKTIKDLAQKYILYTRNSSFNTIRLQYQSCKRFYANAMQSSSLWLLQNKEYTFEITQ